MDLKTTTTAKGLISALSIYRSKYLELELEQLQLFPNDNWCERNNYLTDKRIGKAITNEKPAGYFSTTITNVIGIDMDDHHSGGWIDNRTPTEQLKNNYYKLLDCFDTPSVAVRSPRGIHAYYWLTDKLPARIIIDLTKQKIGDIAEVRPTTDKGLRLPVMKNMVHPENLTPVNNSEIKYIQPHFLFDDRFTPNYQREAIKYNPNRLKYQTVKMIEIEGRFMPYQGSTNESLCILGCIYKRARLTIEEASRRFTVLLQATGYQGELTNQHRLKQRLESVYKNSKDYSGDYKRHEIESSLFDEPITNILVDNCPFVRQRKEPLRRFVAGILDWINYQDSIYQNKTELAFWNYLYPYYRHNMKNGFYPLPRSILRNSYDRYNYFMPYLINSGFLIPAPFKAFSSKYKHFGEIGSCQHYKIERENVKNIKIMSKYVKNCTKNKI